MLFFFADTVMNRRSRNGEHFHVEMMPLLYSKFDSSSVARFGAYLLDMVRAINAAHTIRAADVNRNHLENLFHQWIVEKDEMTWKDFLASLHSPVLDNTQNAFATELKGHLAESGIGKYLRSNNSQYSSWRK